MEYFVEERSIVRRIWGNGDTILFIFAGAAAEFALNKAVEWLYFTGRLPADPLGRLFSTVAYARLIIFSEKEPALKAIDSITAIHKGVEAKRGAAIPDWAYRDVLFLLIDYSIRSFEVMERKMTREEKAEVFDVFNRVGTRMGLTGLPQTYNEWQRMRLEHLQENLRESPYTLDLFRQYRKHLGVFRYRILLESQILIVPGRVRQLLGFRKISLFDFVLSPYKFLRQIKADWLLKSLILPAEYKNQVRSLDMYKPISH